MKGTATTIAALTAAVVAGAAWPWFAAMHNARATAAQTAPVYADYKLRDRRIAFYEREVRRDPSDQIFIATLAGEYLSRFRETGDLDDVTRSQALAERALQLQPQGNVAALSVLASADLAFHQFADAERAERAAIAAYPYGDGARAQLASIVMERGRYEEAARILDGDVEATPGVTWLAIRARYDELTGNLAGARIALDRATARIDQMIEVSAYTRSWYHMRDATLAFEAGDGAQAQAQFDEALRIYPDNAMALLMEARFYRARRDWTRALAAASRSAQLYPLPQALGYQADAQRALGDGRGAADTDALIDAERHLYNAQGVNDRALALYYAQRHTHPSDALTMARVDLAKQGDEIYADDTMAWVLAEAGRWSEARTYAERAVRLGTQDAQVQYHAGAIAMETGHPAEARERLETAMRLNPSFDPFDADDARARLSRLP